MRARLWTLGREPARMPRWAITGLRWSVGLAIVAVLLLRFDAKDVVDQLAAARLELAIPAIAGLVAMHLVGAVTWRTLANRLSEQRIGWSRAVRTYYVAQGLGGLTPGNLGADVYRLYAGPDGVSGWRQSLLPIVVQRITSSVALAALGVGALILLPRSADLWVIVAGAAVLLGVVSSLLALVLRWPGRSSSAAQERPSALAGLSRTDFVVSGLIGLGLGLVFHAGAVGLSYALVASVTPITDPGAVLACLAIARLSILVPISPSGLGFQEGALALLFLRIGLPPEVALAAALLNRLALLATVALGGILLLVGPHREGRTSSSAMPERERFPQPKTRAVGHMAEATHRPSNSR